MTPPLCRSISSCNIPFRSVILAAAGVLTVHGGPMAAAAPVVIDQEFHHLRNAEPREWTSFPEKADASKLSVTFDLASPEKGRVLTLRQEETKQPWTLTLNGVKLGALLRDHNHIEHAVAIPEGNLKRAGNVLEIATASETPDDIRVGDLAIHDTAWTPVTEERAAELFQQRGYRPAFPEMPGVIRLSATEAESGEALPCRFTIVDAETGALVLIGAESDDRLAIRPGVVYTLDGRAEVRLAGDAESPRRYRVYCGRGFEYSLESSDVVTFDGDGEGEGAEVELSFELIREVPTPGLVACDPHLHTFEFDRHGDCNVTERLISIAGEGVELPVSTAHNKHVDYAGEAQRIGAEKWMTPVLGCEVTTSLGHFNTFPIEPGAAPAEHKLRPWDQIFHNIFATPGVRVCILNHGRDIHSGFRPFDPENFDAETGTFTQGRELKANATELINSGAHQTDPLQLVRDWFALLKSGHRIAGIGSSDSHTVNFAIPGQARTYLEAPDENAGAIDVPAAIDSLLAGKSWVSFGLLTRLEVQPGNRTVTAKVLGSGWAKADTLRLFLNGEEVQTIVIPKRDGTRAGEKFSKDFSFESLGAKSGDFFCAVATGPGITEPWWPIMPSYQPTSPEFTPFVMGVSPVVWVR